MKISGTYLSESMTPKWPSDGFAQKLNKRKLKSGNSCTISKKYKI